MLLREGLGKLFIPALAKHLEQFGSFGLTNTALVFSDHSPLQLFPGDLSLKYFPPIQKS